MLMRLSIVLLLLAGCSATPAATRSATPPTQPAPASWHEVIRFQGDGIKNTETFHVESAEWRISWDTRPGQYGPMNFQIYTYHADGKPAGVGVAANVIGSNKDSSIMRGKGDYYFTINSGQPYTVVVEAKQ